MLENDAKRFLEEDSPPNVELKKKRKKKASLDNDSQYMNSNVTKAPTGVVNTTVVTKPNTNPAPSLPNWSKVSGYNIESVLNQQNQPMFQEMAQEEVDEGSNNNANYLHAAPAVYSVKKEPNWKKPPTKRVSGSYGFVVNAKSPAVGKKSGDENVTKVESVVATNSANVSRPAIVVPKARKEPTGTLALERYRKSGLHVYIARWTRGKMKEKEGI